jgi:molybdopterin-guanine dinucleotide biosynthesis protein A
MGVAKATLPFGDELMIQRVVRLLGREVDPIVVVTSSAQQLPPLPEGVLRTEDRRPGRGPLEGLYAGLSALAPHAEAAFAASCDVPLLKPAFVRRMIAQLDAFDVAVPTDGEFHHPLAAVYRVRILPQIADLLDADRLRPVFLYDRVTTRRVPVAQLRAVDAELETLTNLNRPEDYFHALASAGCQLDERIAQKLREHGESAS